MTATPAPGTPSTGTPSTGIAVVTGANSGIGRATAIHLAGQGFAVYGTVRSRDKAGKLRAMAADAGVDVTLDGRVITVKGPKGTLTRQLPPRMALEREGDVLTVVRPTEQKLDKSLHGLTRTLVNNMVVGVTTGYRKGLEIIGVGYRAQKVGDKLQLALGYSHPIEIEPPEGISFELETPLKVAVVGIDKELVGQVAAKVRATRKPEPYKGKGVRYAGEKVRRKAGKAGKIGGKK